MKHQKRLPRRDAGRSRGAPIVGAVLTRTLEELATAGLDGLSVGRIARSAQVNKTSVYRRWPTREALVAAALEGVLDGVAAQVPDTGSLRGDLLGLLGPVVAMLSQPIGRAVVRAALEADSASSIAALASKKLQQRAASPVRTLEAKAQARGEWRAGVRGELLVFTLVGAVMHRVMMEHRSPTKRWLASMVDLVLLGVLPRPKQRGVSTVPATAAGARSRAPRIQAVPSARAGGSRPRPTRRSVRHR